jgi:hypothetical protein
MFLMVLIWATQNRDAALEPKLDECSWPGPHCA